MFNYFWNHPAKFEKDRTILICLINNQNPPIQPYVWICLPALTWSYIPDIFHQYIIKIIMLCIVSPNFQPNFIDWHRQEGSSSNKKTFFFKNFILFWFQWINFWHCIRGYWVYICHPFVRHCSVARSCPNYSTSRQNIRKSSDARSLQLYLTLSLKE